MKLTKSEAGKLLSDVPADKTFKLSDGGEIHNERELADAINIISSDMYAHHVNPEKNDFAKWVSDVIGDDELADRIRAADKVHAVQIVKKHVEYLDHLMHEEKHQHKGYIDYAATAMRSGIADFITGIAIGIIAGLILAYAL